MSDVKFDSTTFERNEEIVVEHYWACADDNHEVVATGEGYDSAAGARKGFLNAAQAMGDAATKLAQELNTGLAVTELERQHRKEGVDVKPDASG